MTQSSETGRLRTALFFSVIAFFALTVALTVIHPTKPVTVMQPGVNAPIIGLEMAFSPFEIWNIIGDPQTLAGQKARAAFVLGGYVDFAYIAAYALCYLFLTWILMRRHMASQAYLAFAAIAVVITASADVVENLAIMQILETGTESLIEQHMTQLVLSTRVKWLFLGISGLPAAILLRREGRRGPSFILTAAFAFGALGILKQYSVEVMTLFLAFFWVYLFVKLLPLKNRWFA
ncbi:MAG: hypothetical protein JNJ69_15710 [Leptospiraceae bacterium]|nr:hypothetical protein [Leptospiraceae bacterium]